MFCLIHSPDAAIHVAMISVCSIRLMEAWEKEQARLKEERMRAGAPQFVKGKPEQAPAVLKGATGEISQ